MKAFFELKDDAHALDFVTAACNLRAAIFHIELTSRWDVKEIAGAIIPAVATTNAIIAGFIVLEALKVLKGDEIAFRAPPHRMVLVTEAPKGSTGVLAIATKLRQAEAQTLMGRHQPWASPPAGSHQPWALL